MRYHGTRNADGALLQYLNQWVADRAAGDFNAQESGQRGSDVIHHNAAVNLARMDSGAHEDHGNVRIVIEGAAVAGSGATRQPVRIQE
jgi:hypothetical protein